MQLQEAKMNSSQAAAFKTHNNMSSTGQMRKQLKLSTDHSDSSFNNMTIKSADKYNSLVRNAVGGVPQTTKNASISLTKEGFLN